MYYKYIFMYTIHFINMGIGGGGNTIFVFASIALCPYLPVECT
jgi:hypothetical protein